MTDAAKKNLKRFNSVFSRSLQLDAAEIPDTLSMDAVPSWDSFNSLLLISELEKEFKMRFLPVDIQIIKNVADLKAGLRKNKIEI